MIPKDTIDKIFESARIEEVVGDFVPLKKKGVNYLGNCPFHNEKTPSFTVSPTKGIYKCFGCGKGGNSVKFIMEIEHYTYPEALKVIAKKYQIDIIEQELTSEQQAKQSRKESLYIVSKFANEYFQKSLWNTEEGGNIGLRYFQERGFKNEIIKKFELGYSPKIKDGLTKAAVKIAFDKDILIESGLSLINDGTGEYVDRFKERTIFPIHSFSGRILGFGGRSFNPKAKAKYLNSPESLIYYKSKILYGLYQSKSAIAKEENCFIVEGYTDVISLHQNGIENVVAASGTALGIDQLKLINRLTEKITLLFDGDEAGIKATYRTINLSLKEGMDVNVIIFPKGEDPDSYSKNFSTNEFKSYLKNDALNFVDYKIQISKLNEQTDPKKIIKSKRDIFKSIANIPDALIRTQYCKAYYKKLDVSEKIMLKEVSQARAQVGVDDNFTKLNGNKEDPLNLNKGDKKQAATDKLINLEKEILRILLNYGNEQFVIDQEKTTVAGMIINDLKVDEILFSSSLFSKLYKEIENDIEKKSNIDIYHFINNNNQKISALAIDLISTRHSISENWEDKHNIFTVRENEKMKETTEKAILSLKKCHVNLQISELQQQISEGKIDADGIKKLSKLTKIKAHIAKLLGRNIG
ncbi:DNA primase [Flavobacteriales bacterium]|nr:DNA primase [Flavobacteriales bacterium]